MAKIKDELAYLELRERVWEEQDHKCFVCRCPINLYTYELAHVIPQRGWCIKLWGADVIHHRKNVRGTCRGKRCNAKVQINPDSLPAEELAAEIRAILKECK